MTDFCQQDLYVLLVCGGKMICGQHGNQIEVAQSLR